MVSGVCQCIVDAVFRGPSNLPFVACEPVRRDIDAPRIRYSRTLDRTRPSEAGSVSPSSENRFAFQKGLWIPIRRPRLLVQERASVPAAGSSWCFLGSKSPTRSARSFESSAIAGFKKGADGRELLPVTDADHTCSRNRKPPDARIAMARANSSSGAASGNTPSFFNSAKRSRPVFDPVASSHQIGRPGIGARFHRERIGVTSMCSAVCHPSSPSL